MQPNIYYLDFETASEADLRKVGLKNYLAHPSTRITYTACLRDGDKYPLDHVEDIVEDLHRCKPVKIIAHNAPFDKAVFEHFIQWRAESKNVKDPHPLNLKWVCTSIMARQHRGPGDLKKAAKFFKGAAKDDDGSALMKKVCQLQAEEPSKKTGTVLKTPYTWVKTPEGYWQKAGETIDELMQTYCDQDVLACRDLYRKLVELWENLGDAEFRKCEETAVEQTLAANARGMRMDTEVLAKMVDASKVLEAAADDHAMAKFGATSRQATAIKRFCNAEGLEIAGTGAPDVARAEVSDPDHPLITDLKELNRLNKSSLRKLPKLADTIHKGRLHDTLVFAGAATTGRWSGRGFQPQNLPRPVQSLDDCRKFLKDLSGAAVVADKKGPDKLAGAIRTLILPEKGEDLHSVDLSQIELRLSVWHSKHEAYNKLLKEGGDVYLHFAQELYKNPALTKDSEERAICKIAVLSLQYGSGARQFRDYLLTSNGTRITEKQAEDIVAGFRKINPGLKELWHKHDKDMLMASVQGRPIRVPLRSGRILDYGKVKKREIRYPGGKTDNTYAYWNGISYKKLWGGTIYQNIVQAEARDIFLIKLAGMAKYPEYKLITTVHDEAVFSVPKSDTKLKERWDASGEEQIAKKWPGLHLSSDHSVLPCYYK